MRIILLLLFGSLCSCATGPAPSPQSLDARTLCQQAAQASASSPEQRSDAVELRRMMAAHRDVRELVEIGAYVPGTNPAADTAQRRWPDILGFLRQDMAECSTAPQAWAQLAALVGED